MTNYSCKCCSGAAVPTTQLYYKRVQTAIYRNNGYSNERRDLSQKRFRELLMGT